MIEKSDKDDKIVIINYQDYISLITESLNKNYEVLPYNEKEILVNMTEYKKKLVKS